MQLKWCRLPPWSSPAAAAANSSQRRCNLAPLTSSALLPQSARGATGPEIQPGLIHVPRSDAPVCYASPRAQDHVGELPCPVILKSAGGFFLPCSPPSSGCCEPEDPPEHQEPAAGQPDRRLDCPGCAWVTTSRGLPVLRERRQAVAFRESTRQDGGPISSPSIRCVVSPPRATTGSNIRATDGALRYNITTDHYEPVGWDQGVCPHRRQTQEPGQPRRGGVHTGDAPATKPPTSISCLAVSMAPTTSPTAPTCVTRRAGGAIQSVGVGKGTVVLDDFDAAKAIFVFGQNRHQPPAHDERPAQGGTPGVPDRHLQQPQRGGLRALLQPQSPAELLTPAAHHHQPPVPPPKLGGDMAAIRGMAKYILEEEGIASIAFIEQHTAHFDDYLAQVKATDGRRSRRNPASVGRRSPGRRRSSQAATA